MALMRLPDAGAAWRRTASRLRERSPRIDHLWRARSRFSEVHAPQLAAAISYFAFFAAFALSLLALSALGLLLQFESLYNTVDAWLKSNLPLVDVDSIEASARAVGLVALATLILAGVRWVQSVRSAVRGVWLLEQQPGNLILRWVVDFAVLVGLGVLLIGTFAVVAAARVGLGWVGAGHDGDWLGTLIRYATPVVGIGVNTVLAAALLSGLPRLALPMKRVLPPALLVAVGLEALKTIGRVYISSVADKPGYQAVGTAVGLLIFLYLFNQMLLFAAAWTATSERGNAVDMVVRKRIDTGDIPKPGNPPPKTSLP